LFELQFSPERSPRPKARLVAIQFPFADLRPISLNSEQRLRTPTWPDPDPGREFVRSSGIVSIRPRGGALDWLGEHVYCDASKLLRLPPGRRQLKPVFRRLFGTEHGYRVDIGAQASKRLWATVTSPAGLASLLLDCPVRVDGADMTLGTCVGNLSGALRRRTSLQLNAPGSGNALIPGTPIVLVDELQRGGGPSSFRVDSHSIGGRRIDVFAITRFTESRDWADVRDLRVAWWRAHFELEVLRCTLRQWRMRPDSFDPLRLRAYLSDSVGRLNRWRRNGVNQVLLISMRASINDYGRAALVELADSMRIEAKGVARKIDLLLERTSSERFHDFLVNLDAGHGLEVEYMTMSDQKATPD
jgi:hypothetical protein